MTALQFLEPLPNKIPGSLDLPVTALQFLEPFPKKFLGTPLDLPVTALQFLEPLPNKTPGYAAGCTRDGSAISRLAILQVVFHGRRFPASDLIQRTGVLTLCLEIR